MRLKVKNAAFTKQSNHHQILKMIRREQVSRADIARRTCLTRAAVSIIVERLLKDRLVLETGPGEGDYGRKPVLLGINPDRYYIIGIDISREGFSAGITDFKGEPVYSAPRCKTVSENISDSLDALVEIIYGMLDKSRVPADKLLGIGISAPGPLNASEGLILNPPNFSKWHNINIVS
jgi:N-acetylglucosamine repressor